MPPVPPTKESLTADLNKAQELLNQKKATMAPVQPTVSANDLATPTAPVQLPQPTQPTIPGRTTSTVANVLNQTRANSENFKRIQEEQAAFGSFAEGQSGFDIQNEQLKRFGVTPEKLKELEDIQLQLSDRGTQSELTKTRIEGAAGQTLGQGQREVTQEDREAAVRDAGLASRAAVLQGNIETGRALANDAVNIALQDRTFQANAKIKQIEYLQGLVDQETSAALEDEKRKYTEELTAIQEVKDAVSEAMVNNASQAEVAKLTGTTLTDAEKLQLSQEIIARNNRPVATTGTKAPDLQNFGTSTAPLWKQWNAATGSWEDVTGLNTGAANPEDVSNTLANFDNLRNVTQQVIDLSEGASPNPTVEFLRKNIGSSSTKNTQLQGFVDTLKANMLTLATDPSIKQFFGPQMSDADVRLMTAAGSNLRPDEQTPAQLAAEAQRIDDWVNRAETAVREGLKGNNLSPNTITAPDGTLIEIID